MDLRSLLTVALEAAAPEPVFRPLIPRAGRGPKHRILRTYTHAGRVWSLHATRGWRSRRA